MLEGVKFWSHGLFNWAQKVSWVQSVSMGSCRSGRLSFPKGSCRDDVPQLPLLLSFKPKWLVPFSCLGTVMLDTQAISSDSDSFLRTCCNKGRGKATFGSSCGLLKDMVSVEEEGGEAGEPSICFISLSALSSNTFNEVAFRYILHNTISCTQIIKISSNAFTHYPYVKPTILI